MPNSATLKNCDQCPLVVPCLARGGLEIRACNVCRKYFYGEKVQDDDYAAEARGRPLTWGKRARPVPGDVMDVPCYCDQHATYQNRIATYRHQWRCATCSWIKFVDVSFKVDFQDSPHIVSEPVNLQICRKETK